MDEKGGIEINLFLGCIFINAFLYGKVSGFFKSTNFIRDTQTITNLSNPIYVTNGVTIHECLKHGHQTEGCMSLLYIHSTKQCLLFGDIRKTNFTDPDRHYFSMSGEKYVPYMEVFAENCKNIGYTFDAYNTVCYKVYENKVTKDNGILSCQANGAHLLRINSFRKQQYFEKLSLSATSTKYRIDGSKTSNSKWLFSNGKEIQQMYWHSSQPADDLTALALNINYKNLWDDVTLHVLWGYICEKDLIPP